MNKTKDPAGDLECAVPLAYCAPTQSWYTTNDRNHWIKITEASAGRLLREAGFSGAAMDGVSPAQSELNRILREEDVDYAGRVAGWPAGRHEVGSVRFLVTHESVPPQGTPGDWRNLRAFLCGLLGDYQMQVFLWWLHFRRKALLRNQWLAGQALVFVGPPGCGKSFTQHLITHSLGGQSAKPWRYMTAGTQFNLDLVGAEHLTIEDEAPSHDIRTRRTVGCAIKTMLYSRSQSAHGKGANALTLEPRWAMSISINDEPENVQVIPPLDDSLADKITILKCTNAVRAVPVGMTEKEWLEQLLRTELAAMLHDVDRMEVDEEHRDPRSGVKAYQHPAALEILRSIAPEASLLALIDEHIAECPFWEGSAEQLEKRLRGLAAHEVERLCRSPHAVGTYLSRLAKGQPQRFEKRRTGARNLWRIKPLQSVETVEGPVEGGE